MSDRKDTCPMRGDIEATAAYAKDCQKALNGNGQPGIITEFAGLKQGFNDFKHVVSDDLKYVKSTLEKLVKESIADDAIEDRKNKTILQATAIVSGCAAVAAIIIDVL